MERLRQGGVLGEGWGKDVLEEERGRRGKNPA